MQPDQIVMREVQGNCRLQVFNAFPLKGQTIEMPFDD
jgi:hypothetical protein